MSEHPWADLITLETVLSLHADGIERFGGDISPPRDGCIEQSLGNAYTAELYNESESAVRGMCFCAYLLLYLTQNHCFTDGNKRVAWASAMFVLLTLGLTVSATDDEAEAFCFRLADSTAVDAIQDGAEVVDWLAERLQPIN